MNLDPTKLDVWTVKNGKLTGFKEYADTSAASNAHHFTRPGEEIAYEYAKFFETLPTAI